MAFSLIALTEYQINFQSVFHPLAQHLLQSIEEQKPFSFIYKKIQVMYDDLKIALYIINLLSIQQMRIINKGSYIFSGLLLFLCLTQVASDLHCLDPQKGYYMSYNALSKKDTLPTLFTSINSKMTTYNQTYNDGKGNLYEIKQLHPQMYYNEHHQKQTYLDPQHVNVTLGDIEFAFRMNYSVTSSKNKTGWARGRVLLDQTSYFIKRLFIKDGYLEWDPTQIANLSITYLITIQYSEPTLQYDDKMIFEQLINDHLGSNKIKAVILNDFNNLYKSQLKVHLNTQEVIGNLTYKYNYKNVSLSYLNVIKNYTLSNTQWKGLEAFFFFQLENQTTNCTPDSFKFDFDYHGGNQEVYSLTTLGQSFKFALTQGLFDVRLDRKWEVPSFQFYMGDLANAVPYAQNYPADDAFEVQCKWNRNLSEIKLNSYDTHEIFAAAGQICTLTYKAKQVLQIQIDISFVVRVIAEDDSLTFLILGANVFGPVAKSLDPNFVVKDLNFLRYAIASVLAGINKSTTFGTGFKIGKRKFPSTFVTSDYLIVFDASE